MAAIRTHFTFVEHLADTVSAAPFQWTFILFRGDLGCFEASISSDLIKEVDAIQACGDQMTADGKRCKTGDAG